MAGLVGGGGTSETTVYVEDRADIPDGESGFYYIKNENRLTYVP